jgi:hypothetical protein
MAVFHFQIVQWISTIYISQMLFLILQIPESESVARLLITYLANSLCIAYGITQLPRRRVHLISRNSNCYWSALRSASVLSAILAYLTVLFLQNSIVFPSCLETERKQLPSTTSNLNWIFLENSYLIKLSCLFVFQVFAYHLAYVESGMTFVQPFPVKARRFG